jgi:regulation of enolase protein 1 (concanavalin A-like superfamily)
MKSIKHLIRSSLIIFSFFLGLTMSVDLNAQITVFEEDFETADLTTRGWTGNLNNHARWSTGTLKPHTGSYSARYDCYNNGDQADMISPTIDLSGTENNILSYWMEERDKKVLWWYNFNHCYVYVSNDNGTTWTFITEHTSVNTYTQFSHNLDDYITPTNSVKIKFVGQGGNVDNDSYDTFIDDVLITGAELTTVVVPDTTQLGIQQHWAPEVYQDIRNDSELGHQYYAAHDFILKVNYDDDWYAGNQRENSQMQTSQLAEGMGFEGHAYSSFVETETHYFLGYGYYHSHDDAVIAADRHENDWEDVYICIQKDGSDFGRFRGMITNHHGNRLAYAASDVLFNDSHPKIYISSNGDVWGACGIEGHGHGIERWQGEGVHCEGGDAVKYTIADVGTTPVGAIGYYDKEFNYALIDVDELWNRRLNFDNYPFETYTRFGGDGVETNGGNQPWNNAYFNNPASIFPNHFPFLTTEGNYSTTYIHNPYYGNGSDGSSSPICNLNGNWTSTDIGSPAKEGYSWISNETFTISGGGAGVQGTSDELHFVYQQVSGDAEIIARVYSVQEDLGDYSHAGLMMRETLNSDSKFAFANASTNGESMFIRRNSVGGASQSTSVTGNSTPVWIKLVRAGNTFTSYYGNDGESWTLLSSETMNMSSSIYVGLAVTSSDVNYLCSSTFTNVSLIQSTLKSGLVESYVEEKPVENRIHVFSRNDQLIIKLGNDELIGSRVVVADIMGRKVIDESIQSTTNVYPLHNKGLYIVNIKNKQGDGFKSKILIR